MYHISNDKRAVRSAELVWEGLEQCLREKELKKIRIADINEKCYVSRATFYRLFDSVEDVLAYRCDRILEAVAEKLDGNSFSKPGDLFLYFVSMWLEQKTLTKALAENSLTNLLYEAHMRKRDLVKRIFANGEQLADLDYLVSILSSLIPAVISTWYEHGQNESAETVYAHVAKCTGLIATALNS